MPLSIKHRSFVDSLFLHNMNATEAYCDVYGVDRETGAVNGCKLLTNAKISETIKTRLNEKAMSADEVLTRLADIARGDIADLMDVTTSGFTLQLMIDGPNGEKIVNPKTKLIKKIKQKTTIYISKKESEEDREVTETEIELYSSHEALRDIGKHLSLFIDRDDDGHPIIPVTTVEVVLPPEETGDGQ